MPPRYRLLCSFFAGCGFALLTWIAIGDHAAASRFGNPGGTTIIFLVPGIIAGFAVSGNIHAANTWFVAIGNFLFYAGLAYLSITLWSKLRAK
jgi:hypothetical protein